MFPSLPARPRLIGRFRKPGLRIIRSSSHLCTTKALWAFLLRKSRQMDPRAGLSLLIQRCVASTWVFELGNIVSGAFAHADEVGSGEYLPLVGDFMSFNEVVGSLNRHGHKFSFKQVPKRVFAAVSLVPPRRQRRLVISRLTLTWVRIRTTGLRSQPK
jgi:hypothetical protein